MVDPLYAGELFEDFAPNVAGIIHKAASIVRLVGAIMLKRNDEWSLNWRDTQLEGLQTVSATAAARWPAVDRSELRISSISGMWTYTMRWDTTLQRRLFAAWPGPHPLARSTLPEGCGWHGRGPITKCKLQVSDR